MFVIQIESISNFEGQYPTFFAAKIIKYIQI